MRLHSHDIRCKNAIGLLVVFVVGGLFAPVVHRIQHGVAESSLRGAAAEVASCDHARHGRAFEQMVPALHSDLCALCTRSLEIIAGSAAHPVHLQILTTYHAALTTHSGADSFTSHLIRGPPFCA